MGNLSRRSILGGATALPFVAAAAKALPIARGFDPACWTDAWLANGGTLDLTADGALGWGAYNTTNPYVDRDLLTELNSVAANTDALRAYIRAERPELPELTRPHCFSVEGWIDVAETEGLRVMLNPKGELEMAGGPAYLWGNLSEAETEAAARRCRALARQYESPGWQEGIARRLRTHGVTTSNGWTLTATDAARLEVRHGWR